MTVSTSAAILIVDTDGVTSTEAERGEKMIRPLRVMIADNSVRAREGLRALLATCPEIEVVGEATNGYEAVCLVREYRPDAVLMDLQMPVMDGLQATQSIKDRWPEVIVVVLTLYASQRAAARTAGADAFVIKGNAPDELLAALCVGSAVAER